MSFYTGLITGSSITLAFTVAIDLFVRSGGPKREDIYRSGYEQALKDVTLRMMDSRRYGWREVDLRKSFESFVEPQYKAKMINCPYNLPW